jgi:DNA-binding cell septation regulator SpoVG
MIGIEHHGDQFNVTLTSPGKTEPFVTIKGCRVVSGSNGPFVSWPARKMDNGKYWNHVYASNEFTAAVLAAYNSSIDEAPPAPRQRPAAPAPSRRPPPNPIDPRDDDVPF